MYTTVYCTCHRLLALYVLTVGCIYIYIYIYEYCKVTDECYVSVNVL